MIPRITVRAFAELLNLPAYEQVRILHDQKYPRRQPQVFRVPFYQPALHGIREYYRSGNSQTALAVARENAEAVGLEARRAHNLRVIDQFKSSSQARRKLSPFPSRRYSHTIAAVDLRLQFDLVAHEGETRRYILYNLRNVGIHAETARVAIEIAHWVLSQEGLRVPVGTLEFVDITADRVHTATRVRQRTLRQMQDNAAIIETLWPNI